MLGVDILISLWKANINILQFQQTQLKSLILMKLYYRAL
jgi:hypothetical protein